MASSEVLRRAVEQLGAPKHRRRFEGALRKRLVGYVAERIASGVSMSEIERELGVSRPTIRRLAREPALVPVRLAEEPGHAAPRLVLRGPHGVVVEGTVDDLASLIIRLHA
jgi:transposase-like protein